MTANKEPLFWMSDESWWFIGDDDKYHLTDDAPERAVKSFELWNSPFDETASRIPDESLWGVYL